MKYDRRRGPASLWGASHPGATRMGTARNEIMGRNHEYVAKMQERLAAWDAEAEALGAAGGGLAAEARAACDERIRELRVHRDAAHSALQDLRRATVGASREIQARVELAWDTMSKALAKAASDLRG